MWEGAAACKMSDTSIVERLTDATRPVWRVTRLCGVDCLFCVGRAWERDALTKSRFMHKKARRFFFVRKATMVFQAWHFFTDCCISGLPGYREVKAKGTFLPG